MTATSSKANNGIIEEVIERYKDDPSIKVLALASFMGLDTPRSEHFVQETTGYMSEIGLELLDEIVDRIVYFLRRLEAVAHELDASIEEVVKDAIEGMLEKKSRWVYKELSEGMGDLAHFLQNLLAIAYVRHASMEEVIKDAIRGLAGRSEWFHEMYICVNENFEKTGGAVADDSLVGAGEAVCFFREKYIADHSCDW